MISEIEIPSGKTLTSIEALDEILGRILNGEEESTLYASVGTAEVIVNLRRYFNEAKPGKRSASRSRLTELRVCKMKDEIIEILIREQLLPDNFKRRLETNLDALGDFCRRAHIQFKQIDWPRLPAFHGFVYGDAAYVAHWAVNGYGQLHHDTELAKLSGKKYRKAVEHLRKYFSVSSGLFPLPD